MARPDVEVSCGKSARAHPKVVRGWALRRQELASYAGCSREFFDECGGFAGHHAIFRETTFVLQGHDASHHALTSCIEVAKHNYRSSIWSRMNCGGRGPRKLRRSLI